MSLTLTNSMLTTAETCGQKFVYRYLDKVVMPSRPPLVRGTVVHGVVRMAMRQRQDTETLPTVEEVADVAATLFAQEWDGQEVDTRNEEGVSAAEVRDQTKDIAVNLSVLHRTAVAPAITPLGVELRVTVEPKDVALTIQGTIDLVAKTGGYDILDTKTAEKSPPKTAAASSQQLGMYALLGLAKFGVLPDQLRLDYLVQTPARKELKYVPIGTTRDLDDVQVVINRINAVARAIEQGVFIPAPPDAWQCQTCEYREARNGFGGCPFVRRGALRPTT